MPEGDTIVRAARTLHRALAGERWQVGSHAKRIAIETAEWVAVAFNVHEAEFVAAVRLARHRAIATLGPDLLGDFDAESAIAHNSRRW